MWTALLYKPYKRCTWKSHFCFTCIYFVHLQFVQEPKLNVFAYLRSVRSSLNGLNGMKMIAGEQLDL